MTMTPEEGAINAVRTGRSSSGRRARASLRKKAMLSNLWPKSMRSVFSEHARQLEKELQHESKEQAAARGGTKCLSMGGEVC